MGSAPGFRYQNGGLHFPGLGLWMDPKRAVRSGEWVVVTHAHSDHTARHSAVILTEPTRRLMRQRIPGNRLERVLDYHSPLDSHRLGEPTPRAPFTLSLHPAGHILGSAMARLEFGGDSVLYTGDFKLRPGLAAEPCEPVAARTLIMETTYGRPRYRFPPNEDVRRDIVAFCREALADDHTPVLLGYSLGKSQEILSALEGSGLPIQLHPSSAAMTRIYMELGRRFPAWEPLDPATARGRVVITPTARPLLSDPGLTGPLRIASISGWALDSRASGDPSHRNPHRRFPLSDHADYDDLLEFVRRVAPERVFTLHGFASDFARVLRRQGIDACAISEDDQLELPL